LTLACAGLFKRRGSGLCWEKTAK